MAKPTVLVVDDDGLCEAVTTALESEGYRAGCARGIAALDLACETQPDAILMDVMLRALNSAHLSRLFRAHPRTAHIPIIVMGTRGRDAAPPSLVCDAWLTKPFDLLGLVVAVDMVTGGLAAR